MAMLGQRLPNARPPPMLNLDLERDDSVRVPVMQTDAEPGSNNSPGWERLTPGAARTVSYESEEATREKPMGSSDSVPLSTSQMIKSTTRSVTLLLEDKLNQINIRFSNGVSHRVNDDVDIILDGELPRCCFLRALALPARLVAAVLRYAACWAVVMAPLLCAFAMDGEQRELISAELRNVDTAVTVIYGFGAIVVRLRTTVLGDSRETEVAAPWRVCRTVLATPTFWLDFLSLAPLTQLVQPVRANAVICRWLPLAALLRAWRLRGFDNEGEMHDRWFQYKTVIRLLVWTVIIAHFYACLWFLVMDLSDTLRYRSWADADSMITFYSHALVAGAGVLYGLFAPEPLSDAERFLLTSLFPISATVMAILFAELVMVATRISIISHKRHEHMAYIQSATQQLGVEPALRRKILKYHSFLQWHHDTEMYRLLFSSISEQLLHELKWQLFRHFIREAPLLHNLGMERILELILAFQEFVFCPGDIVVRHNDEGYEMYFVVRGVCDVLDEHSKPLAVKNKGDYFGEICLFFPEIRRTATVQARTFCVIAKLTRDNFDNIIHEGSEERQRMMKRIAGFHNVKLPPSPPRGVSFGDSPENKSAPPSSPGLATIALDGQSRSNDTNGTQGSGSTGKVTPEEAVSPDGWARRTTEGVPLSPDWMTPSAKAAAGLRRSQCGSGNSVRTWSDMPKSADTLLMGMPQLDVSNGVPISPKRSPPQRMLNSGDGEHFSRTPSAADSPLFGGIARERAGLQGISNLEAQVQKLVSVVEELQGGMLQLLSTAPCGPAVPSERHAMPRANQHAAIGEKQANSASARNPKKHSLGYFGSLLAEAAGDVSESGIPIRSGQTHKMHL